MKNLKTILLAILFCITISQTVSAQNSSSILMNIESKIDQATGLCFQTNSTAAIDSIFDELSVVENIGKTHWKSYWMSYSLFKKSIINSNKADKNIDLAKNDAEQAIEILEKIKNKNAEDYALLGYIKGYTLQWASSIGVISQSMTASKWVSMAVEMGENNPRANFVFANNDYHTPAFVGGGKKTLEFATRAVENYKESIPNPMTPNWGMESNYALLIRTCLKNEDKLTAKKWYNEGIVAFPNGRELKDFKF